MSHTLPLLELSISRQPLFPFSYWLSIVSIHQNFPDVPPWLLPEELVCVELPPEELPLELDTTLDVTLDATSTSEF